VMDIKACSRCGGVFPATTEYFYRRRTDKTWLQSWCIACLAKYCRAGTRKLREERLSRTSYESMLRRLNAKALAAK
jgi:hypothetical protein